MQTHAQLSLTSDKNDTDLKKTRTKHKMKRDAQKHARLHHSSPSHAAEPGHRSRFYMSPVASKSEQECLNRLEKSMKKAANDLDIDTDDGFTGIADYGANGQTAMRVKPNEKCNGCQHYNTNLSACAIGLVPVVCGDGSYPEIGYSPVSSDRLASRNWMNRMKDTVNTSVQAGTQGLPNPEVPYRIDVLGDSALALSDKMDLAKANMGLDDFAYVMGTTVDVVRDIAHRLGDKAAFAEFIKSKLPDIIMAHGLDEAGVTALYSAAVKSVQNLSLTEWEAWKGVSFEQSGVTDEALARAISDRGILDSNSAMYGSIITPAEPYSVLESPEPIQQPQQNPVMGGFVGGNLHLADSLSRRS